VETQRQTPETNLCKAILREATSRAEETILRAKAEAAKLIAQAEAEAEKTHREKLADAEAEATRRRGGILAAVPIEANREHWSRVALLAQTILEQARQKLVARRDYDYRASLVALATEALSFMPGEAYVIRLSPADRAALGNSLAGEIAERTCHRPENIALEDDPAITQGGLVVQDAEGRRVWDNRLPQRLERMWPELRRQIAVRAAWVAENPAAGGQA
jgi:vacuolar-type H+-ATPase subunit E/Vma4